MRTIEKLALRDDYWYKTALTFCKDKDLARDLVQDMYIRLADAEPETDWYVITTIKNLFLDMVRKNRTIVSTDIVNEISDSAQEQSTFEPTDEEKYYLDKFYELDYTKQELIAESYYKSDRQIGEEFNINYGYVHKKRIEGIKEILGDDFSKYNNSSLKHLIMKEEEPEEMLTDEEFNDWVEGVLTKDKMTNKEFEEWINKVTK